MESLNRTSTRGPRKISDEWEWVDISLNLAFDIHTIGYEPLNGSSWVPLPKFLASKKALITWRTLITNASNGWCIASAFESSKKGNWKKQVGSENTWENKQGWNFVSASAPNLQEFEKFCPHPHTSNLLPPHTFSVSNPHLSENY